MDIREGTALVTGANRGIGRHIAAQLLERGAKVYAAARRPESLDLPGAEPIALDITDPAAVEAAARRANDVDLLINNAALATTSSLLGDLDLVHAEMNTNFWGTLSMVRAFAPVLSANGGGTIANIGSAAAWMAMPDGTAYAATKAAVWNMSNGLRHELAGQGTLVSSVHLSATDTEMGRDVALELNDPADVARATIDGIERGDWEIIVDEQTAMAKEWLAKDPKGFYVLLDQMMNA